MMILKIFWQRPMIKRNPRSMNVILQCCKNQALKSYSIEVIDMKEMISVNNVDIKHPGKMIQKYI